MARPRIHDKHLPPYVYHRHGAYYYVRGGEWKRLGETLPEALSAYGSMCEIGPKQTSTGEREQRVYVVRARGLLKIGIAADLSARVRTLRTSNPHVGDVLYFTKPIAKARQVELEVHRALDIHRVDGEWFYCSKQLAIETIRRCIDVIQNGHPLDKAK